MQEQNESKALRFFEEKGFYIVLSLCVIAIGTAAYVLFLSPADPGTPVLETPATTVGSIPYEEDGADKPVAGLDVVGEDAFSVPRSTTSAVQTTTAASTTAKVTTTAAPKTTAATTSTAKVTTTAKAAEKKPTFFVKPVSGEVYQEFSGEELVYDRTCGDWRTHNGVDFLCADGAKVMAVADGVVKDIFTDDYYGTSLLIDHGAGLQTIYLGLMTEASVFKGQKVSAGDVVGAVDADALFESSLPVHFHLEVMQDGTRIDPMTLFV